MRQLLKWLLLLMSWPQRKTTHVPKMQNPPEPPSKRTVLFPPHIDEKLIAIRENARKREINTLNIGSNWGSENANMNEEVKRRELRWHPNREDSKNIDISYIPEGNIYPFNDQTFSYPEHNDISHTNSFDGGFGGGSFSGSGAGSDWGDNSSSSGSYDSGSSYDSDSSDSGSYTSGD